MNTWKMIALLLVGAALAPAAQAYTGYTRSSANLRTGPDTGYPRIVTLPAGTPVEIYGCVDDWSWCDVMWRGERGWLSGGLIDYSWTGQRVVVQNYGPQLGLPVLAFAFDAYWGSHYRNRNWYRDRDRWRDYRPPARPVPPPRPPVHSGPRPPSQVGPAPRPPGNSGHAPRPPSQGQGSRPPVQGPRPTSPPTRPVPSTPPSSSHRPPQNNRPAPSRPQPQPQPQQRPAPKPAPAKGHEPPKGQPPRP